jgi:hypothetical protein
MFDEEGQNLGGLFFSPPYQRVSRIPVTPDKLLLFANLGKWHMQYPTHKLPKFRLDILMTMHSRTVQTSDNQCI